MSRLVLGACSESLAGRRTCSSLVSRVRIFITHTDIMYIIRVGVFDSYLKRTARDTK